LFLDNRNIYLRALKSFLIVQSCKFSAIAAKINTEQKSLGHNKAELHLKFVMDVPEIQNSDQEARGSGNEVKKCRKKYAKPKRKLTAPKKRKENEGYKVNKRAEIMFIFKKKSAMRRGRPFL